MKFIAIKEGFSVRKSDIESVERINQMKSRVVTRFNSYEVNFPYETILKLLEIEGIEEKVSTSIETNEILKKIVNNQAPQQYFAG